MKIEVTKKHIKLGLRYDDCKCPIALAVREAIGDEYAYVSVGIDRIEVLSNTYPTNEDVKMFITDFDNFTAPVHPFTFELPIEGKI